MEYSFFNCSPKSTSTVHLTSKHSLQQPSPTHSSRDSRPKQRKQRPHKKPKARSCGRWLPARARRPHVAPSFVASLLQSLPSKLIGLSLSPPQWLPFLASPLPLPPSNPTENGNKTRSFFSNPPPLSSSALCAPSPGTSPPISPPPPFTQATAPPPA